MLEFGDLTFLVLVNFIKTDEQRIAKCHFLVKLVAKVEVVKIVTAKLWRKDVQTESTLATSLISNEKRYGLITMLLILAHPMNYS